MKHVYSGTELRAGSAARPPETPRPEPGRTPGGPSAGKGRSSRAVGIAVLLALLAGLGFAGWKALQGRGAVREAGQEGVPYAPVANPAASGAEYLETDPLQAKQLFEFVRNSAHVQGNAHYREVLGRVQFVYESGNDEVNAYAFAREDAGEGGERPLEIHCNAGAARFARLISLAMAAQLSGRGEAVQGLLEAMSPGQFGVLGERDADALLRKAGLEDSLANAALRRNAESIASGMLTFVLAHESGHQALGHVFGNAANLEVSRNQEREADTFASSVIATSPYGEYIFAGTLFWQYALARQEGDSGGRGTHPLARERLENLVRQNEEMAAAFGISAGN